MSHIVITCSLTRNSVIIMDNRLYAVQTMQVCEFVWSVISDDHSTPKVYYTTYDLRREYDTINPRTHCDVMVLSGETRPQHPYWYARVLGIYYFDVWLVTTWIVLLCKPDKGVPGQRF